jgi:hypothetical protein
VKHTLDSLTFYVLLIIGLLGVWAWLPAAAAPGQPFPAAPCATLVAARAQLPTPAAKAQLGALLHATAAAHPTSGLGLSRKTSGNRCPSPVGEVSCDVLMLRDGTYWDVLRDADGAATATCGSSPGRITDQKRGFVAVAPAEPPAAPTPPVVSDDTAALQAAVAGLQSALEGLRSDHAALAARVAALEGRPVVSTDGLRERIERLEAATYAVVKDESVVPALDSSRTWGHTHELRLKVVRQ